MTGMVCSPRSSEILSPFTSNLQRNCSVTTHDVTRRRRSCTPSLYRLARDTIIATLLIHPLLLFLVSSTESVSAATSIISLPVIEKEGRAAAVGVDNIAPVSLRNDMLDDGSMMDDPFNIFSEEKDQCYTLEQKKESGGGNIAQESIIPNHEYSTADNKITRMDFVQASPPSELEEEYLIEESNVICVNCHALFQVQVMIHGKKKPGSALFTSTNDLLGNDQWYISLQEVGHDNGVVLKSIYMNYALDLNCEHTPGGDYCHGTSSPTLDTCRNAVRPFTCRSVAKLLVPYSSLLDGLDLDYSTHGNAYHHEVVILASLTRESNVTSSSYYSSSSRRVVDRWLVNVAVPTMRRGIGGDKKRLDGRLKSQNPIYYVKLKDKVHVNTGEEESSMTDAITYISINDWYVKCGVSVSGALLAAIVVLAAISKFITNDNDHEEEEEEEEEVDYGESTLIHHNSDQQWEEIIEEDKEEEELPSGYVIFLGERHSRYSPTVTGMGGRILFQGDGGDAQEDRHDDETAHSDRKTNTKILNHLGQNDVRTSSQDVMSHSDDNSSPVHSNVLNVETNENNNTSGYGESVSNADNSPNTNIETNADAAMHLEIYSPQYLPEEESAPLPHSNTLSVEEKSDQQVPEQTDADNSSNTAMHLEIYSPQSEEEIAPLPHSNTLSMEEKSEQQNKNHESGNGTSSRLENQSDISNDASKSGNGAHLLCDVDNDLQEDENDDESELGREANGSISSNTAQDKASSNYVVLEEKSAREESLAGSELRHENGKANDSPEINLLDTSVSSPEDECDLQCLHFSSSKVEEETSGSLSLDEKSIPEDVASAHECEDINANKATTGTTADIETQDADQENASHEPTRKQSSPSDGRVTERVQNVNNNKTSPSEEISSKCSFPITQRNTYNKRRKASKSVVLSSHQLANSKSEEDESSIGRKYYHLSALAREIQHVNEIDAMQDAQVAHAATAAFGEGADDLEASGLDTDEDEDENDDGDTKRNPYIDEMAREDYYKRRLLHEEESGEESSSSSTHQVNKENLPSPVDSLKKQNGINEHSIEQNDDSIDFSGCGDDSSPDRTPLSSRLSTNNMALFMHQNSSPSSTVAATVHDERATSRKPQTKAKDEIREKPLPVRSGGSGQSKRFGVSPAPSIFPSLEPLFSQSKNEQSQPTSDNVDYGAMDRFESDSQQNQWNRPRKRSRSKKEKRKIRKKLLATTKRPAVHKPSSSLRPLSQMMEEPVWQSNAEHASLGRVSSEMSY